MGSFHSSLDFVKSGDVNALYVVLKGLDLLRQFLDGNLKMGGGLNARALRVKVQSFASVLVNKR